MLSTFQFVILLVLFLDSKRILYMCCDFAQVEHLEVSNEHANLRIKKGTSFKSSFTYAQISLFTELRVVCLTGTKVIPAFYSRKMELKIINMYFFFLKNLLNLSRKCSLRNNAVIKIFFPKSRFADAFPWQNHEKRRILER